MGNRNSSARARRDAKKTAFISPMVDWFNRQENERLYQMTHASSAMPHPLYAQPAKRQFCATLPITSE